MNPIETTFIELSTQDLLWGAAGIGTTVLILIGLGIASTIMAAIGLWKSARHHHGIWFILLFFFGGTFIVPLIYLILHGRDADPLPIPQGTTPPTP